MNRQSIVWIVNTEGEGVEMKWTGKTLEIDGDDQWNTLYVVWCGVVRYDDVTYLVLVVAPLLSLIVLLHNNGQYWQYI